MIRRDVARPPRRRSRAFELFHLSPEGFKFFIIQLF